jgi:hypothetical protein
VPNSATWTPAFIGRQELDCTPQVQDSAEEEENVGDDEYELHEAIEAMLFE